MSCLDETTLALFALRQLPGERIGSVEQHLDSCTTCRRVVGELARGRAVDLSQAPTVPANAAGERPALGDRIDRYVLLEVSGSGAMGTVYAAYDPVLDRKVALKVLHGSAGEQLLREAQALARVSSQNVVAIHDVGTANGRIYIAMELVGGGTLRAWLAESRRSWREVVRVLEAAGRGLAAAHSCGLVHRDFKPDNVLVGDRVRVADFGLAAAASSVEELGAGTPAYMAPEQLAGEHVDAKSDQFSFCITLYEALYGERPFAATRLDELRTAIAAGTLRPSSRAVPAWLRAIVVRGLAADPAQRHASIDALLQAIAQRRRRRTIAIAAGGALAITAASATLAITLTRAGADPCRAAEALPPEPSDPIALRVAFTTATPDGAAIAERVLDRLGAWRHEVAELHAVGCRAAPSAQLDLRTECIAQTTERVRAVAGELAHPTPAVVDGALAAVDRAADLRACRDVDLRRPRQPSDPVSQARADELTRELAAVEATLLGGKYADARDRAAALATAAARAELPEVEAHAWELSGRAQLVADEYVAADPTYRKAVAAAERSGDDALRASLYLELALIATSRGDLAEGERWVAQAQGLVDRLQLHHLEWSVLYRLGDLANRRDDKPTATTLFQQALDRYIREHPTPDDQRAMIWTALGAAQHGDAGRKSMDTAIATVEQALGPHHPAMIDVLTSRGGLEIEEGNPDGGLPFLERAFAIAAETMGRDRDQVARTAQLLGSCYLMKLDWAQAIGVFDRAITLSERAFGENSQLADIITLRGEALAQTGKLEPALADKLRALAIKRKLLPPDSAELADQLEWLGRTERMAKHFDDAVRTFTEALAIRTHRAGEEGASGVAELGLGGTLTDAGKPSEAIAHLEHAIAWAQKPGATEETVIPESHAELGRAYLQLHQRAKGIALLEQARDEYKPLASQADHAADLAEVERMLAAARH